MTVDELLKQEMSGSLPVCKVDPIDAKVRMPEIDQALYTGPPRFGSRRRNEWLESLAWQFSRWHFEA